MAQIDVVDKLAEIFSLTWPYDTTVSLTAALSSYFQFLTLFCFYFVLYCVALCIKQKKTDRFKCTKLIAVHRNYKSSLKSCSADEHSSAAKKKNIMLHIFPNCSSCEGIVHDICKIQKDQIRTSSALLSARN